MADSRRHTQGLIRRTLLQGRNMIKIEEIQAEIKRAIDEDREDLVLAILSRLSHDGLSLNDPIVMATLDEGAQSPEQAMSLLQYAVRKMREKGRLKECPKVVVALIDAGAQIDPDLIHNDFTQALEKYNPEVYALFERMRAFYDKQRSGESSIVLERIKRELRITFQEIDRNSKGAFGISKNATGLDKSRIDMLWAVMKKHFFDSEARNGAERQHELATEFLSHVVWLSSPSNRLESKLCAARNKIPDGQTERIGALLQRLHEGHIHPSLYPAIEVQLDQFLLEGRPLLSRLDHCTTMVDLSALSLDVLSKLQLEWATRGYDTSRDALNLQLLKNEHFVNFLQEMLTTGEIHSTPEYGYMLQELHTLFQPSAPALTPQKITSLKQWLKDLVTAERVQAVLNILELEWQKRGLDTSGRALNVQLLKSERVLNFLQDVLAAGDIQTAPEYEQMLLVLHQLFQQSSQINEDLVYPYEIELLRPISVEKIRLLTQWLGDLVAAQRVIDGEIVDVSTVIEEAISEPMFASRLTRRQGTLVDEDEETDTAVSGRIMAGRRSRVPRHGTVVPPVGGVFSSGGGSVPGLGTIIADGGISSLWNAALLAYLGLQKPKGFQYTSLPELELLQDLLKFKDDPVLKNIRLRNGETIWQTLNPTEPAGVFQVKSLVEASRGQKSTLETAIEKHKAFWQEAKVKLSEPARTYRPSGKKYYFKKNADGHMDCLLKPGAVLTPEEMREMTRGFIVALRNDSGKIDVDIHIFQHAVFHDPEMVQEVATVATLLGVGFHEATEIANAKDRQAHMELVSYAERIADPAPEFADLDLDKDETSPNTIPAQDLETIVAASDFRLMTNKGRTLPKALREDTETSVDRKKYWTKVSQLEAQEGWSSAGATEILTRILTHTDKLVDLNTAPQGLLAHVTPLNPKQFEDLAELSQTTRRRLRGDLTTESTHEQNPDARQQSAETASVSADDSSQRRRQRLPQRSQSEGNIPQQSPSQANSVLPTVMLSTPGDSASLAGVSHQAPQNRPLTSINREAQAQHPGLSVTLSTPSTIVNRPDSQSATSTAAKRPEPQHRQSILSEEVKVPHSKPPATLRPGSQPVPGEKIAHRSFTSTGERPVPQPSLSTSVSSDLFSYSSPFAEDPDDEEELAHSPVRPNFVDRQATVHMRSRQKQFSPSTSLDEESRVPLLSKSESGKSATSSIKIGFKNVLAELATQQKGRKQKQPVNAEDIEFEKALEASRHMVEAEQLKREELIKKLESLGFKVEDVRGDGNCFYRALALQLEQIKPEIIDSISTESEPHKKLRGIVEDDAKVRGPVFTKVNDVYNAMVAIDGESSEGSKDGKESDFSEVWGAARAFNVAILILDSRHPHAGFCAYFCQGGVAASPTYDPRQCPQDRPIVRLAYTGAHYLSVTSHIELTTGAWQEAYITAKPSSGAASKEPPMSKSQWTFLSGKRAAMVSKTPIPENGHEHFTL